MNSRHFDEYSPLLAESGPVDLNDFVLADKNNGFHSKKLSVFFTTLCIVDLFGVFPVIALPRAIICCGWFGIPLVIFVFSLQIYTATILGKCWTIAEKIDPSIIAKSRYPYAAIAEKTYGRALSLFVTILLDVTVFGGGIPNLLVASQNLQLIGLKMTNNEFNFSFCYWLIIIGIFLCPIMWLGSPKNMKSLASVSVCTVLSVSSLTWFCILTDNVSAHLPRAEISTVVEPHWFGVTGIPPLENILLAYGIMAFQFDVHPMLLTIQVDMQDKTKIGHAVCTGILITGTMFAVTTVLSALRYGVDTHANILDGLPPSMMLYLVTFLVTLQLYLSNAVGSSALFQNIEDILHIPQEFNYKRVLLRSGLVALAVSLGEAIPRFDLIMGIIGGTLTGPLMFVLPPLLYTKMLKLEKKHNEIERETYAYTSNSQPNPAKFKYNVALAVTSKVLRVIKMLFSNCVVATAVVFFGLIATIVSTYFSVYNVLEYSQFSTPCLFNISSASSVNDL